MSVKKIAKGTGKVVWTLLSLPWRAVKMNLSFVRRAKETHRSNIVMIRDMVRDASRSSRRNAAEEQSFDEALESRGPDAPTIAQLERRFLLQKRLALWTCMAFVVLALYGIAHGSLLAIATLVSSLPLFFMAALSAQLRLWQLRTRRLSRAEKGGLVDFIREIRGWYWEVLDPEYGKNRGK
jgi:hypothetical protein